jgi:hypothetical protein
MKEKIENLISELKQGNPYVHNWIIEELEDILKLIKSENDKV